MIGQAIDRVDGFAKVTGGAKYSAEFPMGRLAYAVILDSTAPHATITSIDTSVARRAPGVITILTHENAPKVHDRPATSQDRVLRVLQDNVVLHDRQPIALVVAETFEQATAAANMIHPVYAKLPAITSMDQPGAKAYRPEKINGQEPDETRGDPTAALASAPVKIVAVYTTPNQFHNPMEPHATTATWDGDKLTVYDASQGVFADRKAIANALGVSEADVHVITKFTGGGFGSKGATQSHQVLAAMAAKVTGRPIKLVLSRPQMFFKIGYRPATHQEVSLGADRTGKLVAITHDTKNPTSVYDEFIEPSAMQTRALYSVPNMRSTHRAVRIHAGTPTYMRAPGESSGTFALESAMDELSYAVGIDPIELRLRNYAEIDESKNLPFTSKSLRQCYAAAAERFGWSRRNPAVRSMRSPDGMLVGMGMATATYPTHRSKASAKATMHADGTAFVTSGGTDIGTGAYTVFLQVAADELGLSIERVRFDLGDTLMPQAPVAGGSQQTASVGSAVAEACKALREKIAGMAIADTASPLAGHGIADLTYRDGRIVVAADSSRSEAYAAILARHGGDEVSATVDSAPGAEAKKYAMDAFGAQFVEVHVDPDFGTVRVAKFIGAFAAGTIINPKTARSQYIGGMVWGMGFALLEQAEIDERIGRVMNANLGEYLVPVNADVNELDALIVQEHDTLVNPIGVKGIGEIGITGAAAAIANAVYHATGKRIRDLPITPEKLFV